MQLIHDITSLGQLWKVYQFDIWEENKPDTAMLNLPIHDDFTRGNAEKSLHKMKDTLLEFV